MNDIRKGRVIEMRRGGASFREIEAETGVPRATAARFCLKFTEGGVAGLVDGRRNNGARRKTTDQQDIQMVEEVLSDVHEPASDVPARLGIDTSSWVLRQRLREVGYNSRIAAETPDLTDGHRAKRVTFAEAHLPMTAEDWGSVIFTDEKVFSSDKDGRRRVWREVGERFNPINCRRTMSSGRVTMAFHGWIARGGLGHLTETTRGMTAEEYVDILENSVIPSVRAVYPAEEMPVIRIVEDNSPVHTARIVRDWYASRPDVYRFDWPARSPDLNPIENVWSEVVRGFRPRRGETVRELQNRVRASWESLRGNARYIEAVVDSMPTRMRKVIDADGATINY